jgi:thymidylate synthase
MTLLKGTVVHRTEKVIMTAYALMKIYNARFEDGIDPSFQERKILGPVLYPPPRINPPNFPAPNNIHPIRVKTVGAGYLELLYQIMQFGTVIDTHYGEPSRELMNLCVVISDQDPDPETIPDHIPFTLEHLEEYYPRLLTNFEDDSVSYTYGNMIRGYFGVDQVKKVANKLANDESSRSAVISLWDPKWDRKHSPCLNHIWFRLSQGKLFMTCVIRSNDMYFGWPENAYGMRKLQDLVRALICAYKGDYQDDKRYGLGDLTIISQSAHIYERDWAPALEVVKKYRRYKEHWDEKGQWIIESLGEGKVKATLLEPDGPEILELEGTATELQEEIAARRLISDVGNALYVGQKIGEAGKD